MELETDHSDLTGPHPVLSLFAAVFWVFLWLLTWVRSVVAFATISVPRFIYFVLSYSLTLTLNFWSFVIIFILSAVAVNYWIRFRYLNTYASLKEPPLVKPDAKELHPDVNTTDAPPNFHNYLDEFLQAVRVFGFLEKPVFHELARHLQTRRLIAGDSFSLDQDKSFYCVVDGMVQVYAQTGDGSNGASSWDEEDTNGYQLLNEVGSGGTLSSLFTILSLFTEDVKISWQDDEVAEPGPDLDTAESSTNIPIRNRLHRADSDVSQFDLDLASRNGHSRRQSMSSSGTVHPVLPNPASPGSWRQSNVETSHTPDTPSRSRRSTPGDAFRIPHVTNHGTVARAIEDTTLAVIPAEAFRRLTSKFPKATAHIVQVILTRFSRVTFNAAHKYLGLTTEVLRTEKAINDIAGHPLPRSFYEGGGLQHLRQRFDRRFGEDIANTEKDYFSQTHTMNESPLQISTDIGITDSPQQRPSPTLFRTHSSRHLVQAGDLHSSAAGQDYYRPITRSFSYLGGPAKGPESSGQAFDRPVQDGSRLPNDDFNLRDEVMSCIAKSIGLLQPPISDTNSFEASPAFSATDAGNLSRTTAFNSSFGSLSLLETGDDASSITGGSSAVGGNGYLSALDNEVEILFFAANSTLARAGERHGGLFYVIDGFLDISLPTEETGKEENQKPTQTESKTRPSMNSMPSTMKDSHSSSAASKTPRVRPQQAGSSTKGPRHLFTVKPGGIAGYLASLCGLASYVDIVAKTDTYVGFLPYHALERLLEKQPIVLLTLAKRLISLLSPLVLHIDASLDWMQVNAGQVLWRPGDASDSFYIVINGRLRAINDKEGGKKVTIVGEYGQGDPVGELDVITNSPRRYTVHAIRDSELVRLPLTLFNAISARNPQTTAQLLRTIASRVRHEVDSSSTTGPANAASELGRNNLNLKTIAILPVASSVPVEAFAKKLQAALESIGAPTSYLNQASVSSHLGRHAFTRMGKLKVAGWLADQEQQYRTVLYVVDSAVNSPWTQTCIRQADCVMVVGMGDDPSLGEYERLLMSMKTTARKELVILHPDRSVVPGSTREWLKNRPWIHQHIHVELPGLVLSVPKSPQSNQDPAAVAALKNLKYKFQSELQKYRGGRETRRLRPPHMNDFVRLGRRMCGKSIGLVLGGGGARGISHLGVLRALEEYGIPIDHIAGTSIGAFVGGLYAREGDLLSSAGRVKQFSGRMGNIWRMLSDVTYPIVAYTTGHEFNRSIYKAFYDLHIEDMWLPFFCNTTDILASRMIIHDNGYAWRFIRASMTLVGLLPPLCDNGKLLVDGGYIDNLPVSSMFAMGASAVFACDVSSLDDNSPRNFGDTVSGWWLLLNRWNPFSGTRSIPAITEIQSRLAYVSSVKTLEDAKVTRGCLYMQMPVQEYGTLQFSKFEEIQEKGYHAAMEMLEKWDEEGKLPSVLNQGAETRNKGRKKGKSLRRNSI